jgi:hypothetical protein
MVSKVLYYIALFAHCPLSGVLWDRPFCSLLNLAAAVFGKQHWQKALHRGARG